MPKLFVLFILAAAVFVASVFQSCGPVAGSVALVASVAATVALRPGNRSWT